MKYLLIILACTLGLPLMAAGPYPYRDNVTIHDSLDKGIKAASQSGKPIFLITIWADGI